MALDPLELATIGAVILVFFLYGPQKIPELARVIAQARREFDRASREFQNVATGLQDGTSSLLAQPRTVSSRTGLAGAANASAATGAPQPQASPAQQPGTANDPAGFALPPPPPSGGKTGDQLLIEAARRLGIPTQGKTREQIQEDIIAKANSPAGSDKAPEPPAGGSAAR